MVGRGWCLGDISEQAIHVRKSTGARQFCLYLGEPGTWNSGREVGSKGLEKMCFARRISEVSELPSGHPADLVFHSSLPASNKLYASYRLASECPTSPILHCLPFISNTRKSC